MDGHFWTRKRVLVTGHTGFKGSWLSILLDRLGAQVSGIALPPSTCPSLFEAAQVEKLISSNVLCDIRDKNNFIANVHSSNPEVVFHLAAQPIVRESYRNPLSTIETNVMGTANLLEALRGCKTVKAVVVITTDKVYKNLEHYYPYREVDPLGGYDPYSASKAASELIVDSFRDSFLRDQGVGVCTARAGNVIGGGDWSSDRLIPDAIKAWENNSVLNIRSPQSTRPWQHVLDPLMGYIRLAEYLWNNPDGAGAYNFGPLSHEVASVKTVIELGASLYGAAKVEFESNPTGPHEAARLALEISKSRDVLGFSPRWSLQESIARTINWYRAFLGGKNALELCLDDVSAYEGR